MWTRAQLKDRAKAALRQNYWKLVLVALIANAISGVSNSIEFKIDESGVHSDFFAAFSSLEGYLLGVMPFVFAAAFVVTLLAIAVSFLVLNPLSVGNKRFFVKSQVEKAELRELLYAFDHGYKNVVKVLLIRDIKLFLWTCLFIIPGIIKSYEYRMIPYLLADDPELSQEDAFRLTKEMMDGQKADAFVLDMSFLGWEILSSLTWGILGIFYVSPYVHLTDAALYEVLSANHGHPARKTSAQQNWEESPNYTGYEEI